MTRTCNRVFRRSLVTRSVISLIALSRSSSALSRSRLDGAGDGVPFSLLNADALARCGNDGADEVGGGVLELETALMAAACSLCALGSSGTITSSVE